MPPEGRTGTGILPSCPSLDRVLNVKIFSQVSGITHASPIVSLSNHSVSVHGIRPFAMASAINLDYLPAVKMLLHAAKHPAYAVNGLLVCRQQDALEMNIVDYVPLFHSPLTLTPMLETALYQIESYCTMSQLRICGYFQANEHLHDNMPTPFAYKIAEKLNEKSGPACLIM
ncbi:hypothetical protein T265_15300, partial [Opisthorchis viverrini]